MAKQNTIMVVADHTEQGFMIINEDDFDSEKHEIFGDNAKLSKPSEDSNEVEGKGSEDKAPEGASEPTKPAASNAKTGGKK